MESLASEKTFERTIQFKIHNLMHNKLRAYQVTNLMENVYGEQWIRRDL